VLSVFEDFETTNQFKILRTQVLRKLKAIGGNSILVTSANPREGKTFTSINLGVSIAKEFDRTVLIIDADIRRPLKRHTDFSTEFFSLNVKKGLTDYLEGDADIEEILINPGIDKLTLIPGGMPVDNAPELLNSGRMEEMMIEIKSRYPSDRLVILDGPAILRYPDAMILYRYVDGVLPVIEAEGTSTENVKKMMEYLQEVNILGVVLNKNRG
jgi:non-specific protein-tyrosine kinase